jgi:hypothetical protein
MGWIAFNFEKNGLTLNDAGSEQSHLSLILRLHRALAFILFFWFSFFLDDETHDYVD